MSRYPAAFLKPDHRLDQNQKLCNLTTKKSLSCAFFNKKLNSILYDLQSITYKLISYKLYDSYNLKRFQVITGF